MIDGHLVVDVVNFDNIQVKVDSLNEHPTESCREEILHKSCYCNTGKLSRIKSIFYYTFC